LNKKEEKINSLIEKNKISLYDCFDLFTEKEELDLTGMKCDCCSKQAKFSKKYELERSANYLIISLKRFKYTKM